jgi:hypothetical protein
VFQFRHALFPSASAIKNKVPLEPDPGPSAATMSQVCDDERWDNEYDASLDETTVELARQKVSDPAKLMIASGIFMMLIWFVQTGFTVSNFVDEAKFMELPEDEQQPPSPARVKAKQQEENAQLRKYIQAAIFSVINLTLNLLVFIGGLRMRSFNGHMLAIVGAACAMMPINSCCCIGIPVGIWALIVLLSPDVKAAFDAAKQLDLR